MKIWKNKYGEYHREDGPAYVRANGFEIWYINGLRHRMDGPAVTYANGSQAWYLNGENITNEVELWINKNYFPCDYLKWDDVHRTLFRLRF